MKDLFGLITKFDQKDIPVPPPLLSNLRYLPRLVREILNSREIGSDVLWNMIEAKRHIITQIIPFFYQWVTYLPRNFLLCSLRERP